MEEFVPVGNLFLLAREHDLVDEGHVFSTINQQPLGAVARFACARVGFAVKVWIAFQHHARIGVILGQHVRSGADRIPVQCEIFFGHARLAVKAIRFPRDGGKERHRQPVEELRIFALDADAVAVRIDDFDA